jgi:hypothetical protein
MYRFLFSIGSIRNLYADKAQDYAQNAVTQSSLGLHDEGFELSSGKKYIRFDNIGRAYSEVTVSLKSEIFLDGILRLTGVLDDTPLFTATARSECVDITGYAGAVKFSIFVSDKMDAANNLAKAYQSVKSIIQTFVNF